jgi:hypothetical protein
MIIASKFDGYTRDGIRRLYMGGGGGPSQTTSTVQNTNVPEYARPYVETMLGATQEQLFQGSRGPSTVDPNTGQTVQGDFNITGFKPYQAYGGTYDAQGSQTSYDAGKAIAGFQPMQETAQRGIAGLQMPGEFGQASGITQAAAQNAMNMGYQGEYARNQFRSPEQYRNAQFNMQQVQNPDLQNYQMQGPADVQSQGYNAATMGAAQTGYNPQLQTFQMGPAERVETQSFAQPGSADAFMSPYMQNVVGIQQREAQRQADIAGTQRGAAAVKSGAFGGSRQAIMEAEAARNLAQQKGDIQATGLQSAFQQAQGQFNTEQQARLQAQQANQQAGLTVGQQNLASQIGTQQLGAGQIGLQTSLANLSSAQQAAVQNQAAQNQAMGMNAQQAMQAALANQQAGLTVGQQNLAANLGIQQLGSGQNMQSQLANQQAFQAAQQAAEQSRQYGYGQNMTAAQQRAQYGLSANQLNAQQQQFGATYGQNANAQALAAANQLAGIGQQGLSAQQGIYGLQSQVGAQQQALEQQKINQAMQDYANAQQYPLMQLGTMSNMLRGLPMQASTTNQYQAAPNQLSQAIGTIGSGASIYNAFNPARPGGAAGGLPSEFKYAKGGGIMSYDMGGEVESQLENMDEKGLAAQAKESSSPSIRRMAQRILRERQMSKQPQGTGPMGVQYQAAQPPMPPMPSMRAGGIIAFAKGETVYGGPSSEVKEGEEEARVGMQERLAMPPTTGGIMGAAPAPAPAPALPAPTAGGAVQQAQAIPEFMKAQYADAEKRANAPLASFMAERQAALREAGVADVSEGQQKQRAELMAERANMAEEKERQKHLRLAEFFATWGSTPGPTLVAGMNALKKSVPGIISDEKEQKKARREIDKSIADLDNATRLEKRGEVDAAMALKLKAAEEMKALNTKLIDYQSRRESDISSAAASKYRDDMNFRSEQLRANTARLDRLALRENAQDTKAFGQYQTAANQEQRVIAKIIDQAKLLEKDYETIKTAETQAAAKDGVMDPRLIPAYEAAKKKITDQETIWNKQKEQAAKDTDLAYSRIRVKPEAPAAATGAPAPAGGLETRDFPAPPAEAIAALKANPSKKADFDAMFGPGAANEYLGK